MTKFIDIHGFAAKEHAMPYPRKGDGRLVHPQCTAEELIGFYDEMGVQKGVVLVEVCPEGCFQTMSNEEVLDICASHPDRLVPGCNVDPRNYYNTMLSPFATVLKWYKDRGCRILGEVSPSLRILDERVQALFKAAEDVGLPVVFHMAPFVDNDYGLADLPGLPGLELCLQRYPKLKFFGHSQAFWCEMSPYGSQTARFGYPTDKIEEEGRIQELMRKYPNLYGDLSAGSGFNALSRDRAYAAKFLTEFQDRLMFGLDICSPEYERVAPHKLPAFLRELLAGGEISETVFNKVARENAIRMLGL